MQQYRHIPVDVEAIQLTKENAEEVAAWCSGRVLEEYDLNEEKTVAVHFPTLYDGVKRVAEGQMLVKSKAGQFMVHNAGFFETMFKPVEPVKPLPHSHIPGARRI